MLSCLHPKVIYHIFNSMVLSTINYRLIVIQTRLDVTSHSQPHCILRFLLWLVEPMHAMPLSVKDWRICGFGYPEGSCGQSPMDTEGQLYEYLPIFHNDIRLIMSQEILYISLIDCQLCNVIPKKQEKSVWGMKTHTIAFLKKTVIIKNLW